jgi:hypothetical protein
LRRSTLEISIGEIVQGDGHRQSEQVLDAAEQRGLELVAVAHQEIGGAVEPDRRHGLASAKNRTESSRGKRKMQVRSHGRLMLILLGGMAEFEGDPM